LNKSPNHPSQGVKLSKHVNLDLNDEDEKGDFEEVRRSPKGSPGTESSNEEPEE